MRRLVGLVIAVLLATWAPGPAQADSWPPPRRESYVSTDGQYRLIVTPRALRGPLEYFEDKVDRQEPAGQAPGGPSQPRGRLERLGGGGEWELVWDQPLVNDVAPVSAMVTDDGEWSVTFDNWHSVGRGDHVVVIYDRAGQVVRSFTLEDLVPEVWVEALPQSVSSTQWADEHRFEGEAIILRILVPVEGRRSGAPAGPSYFEARVDLATGTVSRDPATFAVALAEAERVHEVFAEAGRQRLAYMAAPVTAPTTADDGDWHQYLREVFFRTDPEWDETYPRITVLRAPGAFEYERSVGWLRDNLIERRGYGAAMIGSASQANLIALLTDLAPEAPDGGFSGARLYVVVDDAGWPTVQALLDHLGATLIQLDPREPVPQRPERMPK